MKITCIPACELSPDLALRWQEILRSEPALDSPYFRPEFVQAVAGVRADVEVGVLEESNQIVGFFPFQRSSWNVAGPVGGKLSDYQAVIAAAEVPWRVTEIMEACRLSAWSFDHQLAAQPQLASFHAVVAGSPYLNLSAGFEAYLAERKQNGGRTLSEVQRKFRKLQRESASVEFEWNATDPAVFAQLLAWKAAQYARCGLPNLFRSEWITSLLERIRTLRGENLAGVLSVLRVDGQPAAIHFSMQSGSVLHSWFPAYDVQLGRHSVGAILLCQMAEHAGRHGVTKIDLGKGTEDYKLSFGSEATAVAEGCVDRRPLAATVRHGWRQARDWVRQSPLKGPAKMPLRWLRQMREWLAPRKEQSLSP